MKQEKIINIEELTDDPVIDVVLDTIKNNKQTIVFVNTKRGAESVAEKISQHLKKRNLNSNIDLLQVLSLDMQHVLSSPTKQCIRLSEMIKYGAAFHHAGLVSKQKELIENNFREGIIKVIVATPTLAMGVDLPAFRVIIRDLKRFGVWGMDYIPVLEYEQQAGRAGRPSYDNYGEAIIFAESDKEETELYKKYITGSPEEIVSKLAVEPIMRTYILSLISSGFVSTTKELEDFFEKTFYAKQYGDMSRLKIIIDKMLEQLDDWEFIEYQEKTSKNVNSKNIKDDFVSALKMSFAKDIPLKATLLGHRVSELYLDPYTANFIIANLKISENHSDLALTHLLCSCLELRPLLRVKKAEVDDIVEFISIHENDFLTEVPEMFDEDFEEFLSSVKTAKFFLEWLDEKDEEYLLEKYAVRPGEISSKKDVADWLIYSSCELCRLLKMHKLINPLGKLRFRLKYGAKEELIPLLQLKNIGRVRARTMFNNGIKDISDLKKAELGNLSRLIGKNIALDIKKQVGQDLSSEKVEVKSGKRKGQINLGDYEE